MRPEPRMPESSIVVRPEPMESATYTQSSRLQAAYSKDEEARSEKDLRAPFASKGRLEGLTIDHLQVFSAEDRFWARFQSDGDAEAFGAQWAAFARAALFPTLAGALDGGVKDPRAAEFVEQLETAVAERLSSAPEPMQIPLASLVLVKRERSH